MIWKRALLTIWYQIWFSSAWSASRNVIGAFDNVNIFCGHMWNDDLVAPRKEKIIPQNKGIMLKCHERNHKSTVNDYTDFKMWILIESYVYNPTSVSDVIYVSSSSITIVFIHVLNKIILF